MTRAFTSRWRIFVNLFFLVMLIIAANFAADWVVETLKFEILPSNEDVVHKTIMIAALVYAALIAIPFIPGIEIGLTLIGMLGTEIVFLVYLCTLAGLSLSFLFGRLLSLNTLIALFDELGIHKVSKFLLTVEPMSMDDRLGFLVSKAPNRFVPFLLQHRYLALAIAVNLPGNFVIGGGGGISLIAGVSKLYSAPGFLMTMAIAVAPVPMAILIFGKKFLSG